MVIDDNFIISFFYGKKTYKRSLIHEYENYSIDNDITKYCKSRYKDSESLKETIFRIKHHIENKPICKQCGKSLHFVQTSKVGFPYKFCSCKCAQKNKDTRIIYKNNCLEKYGVDNPAKSEEIKDKSKKTLNEKYGVDYARQIKEAREKAKQTCLKKYGVECFLLTDEIKEKAK